MVRIRWRWWSGMRFLAVVAAIMLVVVLLFSTFSSPHTEDSHGHAREVDMVERIHVMIVMCNRNKDGTNKEEVRM